MTGPRYPDTRIRKGSKYLDMKASKKSNFEAVATPAVKQSSKKPCSSSASVSRSSAIAL